MLRVLWSQHRWIIAFIILWVIVVLLPPPLLTSPLGEPVYPLGDGFRIYERDMDGRGTVFGLTHRTKFVYYTLGPGLLSTCGVPTYYTHDEERLFVIHDAIRRPETKDGRKSKWRQWYVVVDKRRCEVIQVISREDFNDSAYAKSLGMLSWRPVINWSLTFLRALAVAIVIAVSFFFWTLRASYLRCFVETN